MPDAETTRLEALQNFRGRSQYVAGHAYIIALLQELRQEKRTAIEIAQLYLSQGHYIRAWDACNLPESEIFENGDSTVAFTKEICDPDSAALALLRAFIGISRYGRMKTAFRIADRVYSVWLAENLKDNVASSQHGVPAGAKEELLAAATTQWSALQQSNDDCGPKDVKITESRILMQYWYYKIQIVAAEQGLLEESATKRNAAGRLDALSKWTIVRGRLREARYLIHLRIDLVENNMEDLQVLRGYMSAVADTQHLVEQAETHLDLAKCMLRTRDPQLSNEAEQHVAKAEELFKAEGHVSGLLNLTDMQMDEYTNISLKDRLAWKLKCADDYLKQECHQQGIRCLLFAIPVNHDMGEIFRQTQSMIERVQREISKIGGALLEQVLFVNTIAQSLVRGTEYGYARQALEEYVTRLPDETSNKHLSAMHSSLRGAYMNVGDFEKALFHAEQSFVTSLQGSSYVDISDAAFALAVTKMDRGRQLPQRSDIARLWLADLIRFLSGWVAIDQFMSYYKQAAEKCAWSANVEMQTGFMFNDERAFGRSDEWLDAAVELCILHDVSSPQAREMEILRATRKQDFDLAVEVAGERLRALQAEASTSPFNLAQATTSASMTIYGRFQSRGAAPGQQSDKQRVLATQDFVEAMKLAANAFDLYKTAGGSEMIVTSLNWLWYLIRHLSTDAIGDELKEFLIEAETIEIFCDAIRRSSASTRDVGSLFEKRRLVSGKKYRDLYSHAIETCVELGDLSAAWVWTQKSKARALSDVFGVRAIVPPTLLESIASNEDARTLYERERLNTEIALKAGPQSYLSARRQAESDRAEMRQHPLLSQVLDIREGAFNVSSDKSELAEAMKLTEMSSESIKYVDWFVCSSKKNENKIILLVRQLDGTASFQTLEIDATTIEKWKRRVFGYPEEAETPLRGNGARSKLRELAPLVKGLEEMTEEEDLLIMSPSGVLNGIPLHALPVGNRTLIERNPVIYSSSAAVFRQCHMRATAQASKYSEAAGNGQPSGNEKAAFLTVYESFHPEGHFEQSAIYAHADTISSTSGLPVTVYKGAAATKAAFTYLLKQSPWLHFHGHALFDERDVLRSCLVLSDGEDRLSTCGVDTGRENTPPPPAAIQANDNLPSDDPDSPNLTVSTILSLPSLPTAPHITVIACDSGTQALAPGDEPLGLNAAFLYAGATSVLGTLWPVDSHTARIFSETFYGELRRQVDAQMQPQVDAQTQAQTNSQTQSLSPSPSQSKGEGQHTATETETTTDTNTNTKTETQNPFLLLHLASALWSTVIKMMHQSNLETTAPLHWAGYVLHGAWFCAFPIV